LDIAMKTTLFAVFFLFCAACAFGQSAPVLPNVPAMLVMSDHQQHAEQHALASEQSLLGYTPYEWAKGEQPLWEFPTEHRVTPLGDIARNLRKEHETAKKAEIVWDSQ
jgi:hypothetical protein